MTNSTSLTSWKNLLLALSGLTIGYLAGIGTGPIAVVHADVTEEPRRDSFKAGGVLNEPVLQEIASTLKRIEGRVERIEKSVAPAPLPRK